MNKKILFVITGLGMGGAENQVINLVDNLQNRGHSVTIAYILEPLIILPKNNKNYSIQRCIDSALNQSYTKFEIVFVNDGSIDNSVPILLISGLVFLILSNKRLKNRE